MYIEIYTYKDVLIMFNTEYYQRIFFVPPFPGIVKVNTKKIIISYVRLNVFGVISMKVVQSELRLVVNCKKKENGQTEEGRGCERYGVGGPRDKVVEYAYRGKGTRENNEGR